MIDGKPARRMAFWRRNMIVDLLQCSVERRAASHRFAMMDEMLEVIKQTPRGRSC
jgi:hypothetical protein